MLKILLLLSVALTLTLFACKNSENTLEQAGVETQGTIRYIDLEGGFYGIEADNGTRYNPQDLPTDFQVDGLRVRFRVQELGDVATIQMWGTPVEILEISRLP